MATTIMGAVVSLDGYIADDRDGVGPLFDWYGVMFGSGRPFFATGPLADPILLDNPSQVVRAACGGALQQARQVAGIMGGQEGLAYTLGDAY